MTAEEVLSTMADSDEETQEVCVIDAETQTISVPACYSVLGVESDENTKRVYFRCPAVVGDNVNLMDYSLRINYQNGNKERGVYLINDVSQNGDSIEFSWLLSRGVTAYKGKVNFIFCAVKVDEVTGITINEWNTTLATATVLEGLEPVYSEEGGAKEDLIAQLLSIVRQEIKQPDLSVNDPSDPAYVKNRTHWVEVVDVFPEATVTLDIDDVKMCANLDTLIDFQTGNTYVVNWNSVEYECVCREASSGETVVRYLGNTASVLNDSSANTGEPFCVFTNYSTNITCVEEMEDGKPTSVTLGIKQKIIHTIDPQYIKDMYYSEMVYSEILPETTVVLSNGEGAVDVELSLEIGEKYVVTWNGTSFACIGQEFLVDDTVAGTVIGNYEYVKYEYVKTEGASSTEEPFVIVSVLPEMVEAIGAQIAVIAIDGSTEATLSIAGNTEKVHRLPEKYLPDSFGESTVTLYGKQDTSFSMGDGVMAGYLYNDADCQNVMKTADIVAIADKNITVWFAADDGNTYIIKPNIIAVDMGVCVSGMVNGGGIMLLASDYNVD